MKTRFYIEFNNNLDQDYFISNLEINGWKQDEKRSEYYYDCDMPFLPHAYQTFEFNGLYFSVFSSEFDLKNMTNIVYLEKEE